MSFVSRQLSKVPRTKDDGQLTKNLSVNYAPARDAQQLTEPFTTSEDFADRIDSGKCLPATVLSHGIVNFAIDFFNKFTIFNAFLRKLRHNVIWLSIFCYYKKKFGDKTPIF